MDVQDIFFALPDGAGDDKYEKAVSIDNNTSFKVLAYLLIKAEVQNTKGGNSDYITNF
jgi:hypothetical protein